MKKFSLVSIIVLLLVAGAELSFSQEEHSQLVGLYFLRHDGLENRYAEEIFPLALIRNGEYQPAAVSDYSDPSLSDINDETFLFLWSIQSINAS